MDSFTQLILREVLFVVLGIVCFGLLCRNYFRAKKELMLATENSDAENKIEFLSGIIEHVVDGLITVNEMGIIRTFNPACERIFGYTASEVVGKKISMLMPEPYRSEHDNYMQKYLRTGNAKIIGISREVRGKRKSGEEFPLDLAVSEIPLTGDRRIFVGILRDITNRKK